MFILTTLLLFTVHVHCKPSVPTTTSAPPALTYAPTPPKHEWYPTYHLAPPSGWMNDPNGLIYFDNRYHAFYQYSPGAPEPVLVTWGHATSRDLISWTHEPIAIKPTDGDDSQGCFSGSAVNDSGVFTLMYTGNSRDANGAIHQVQMLATSHDNGTTFKQLGTVLRPPVYTPDFRDPKVWRQDGEWYVVIGTPDNGHARVVIYKSKDLREWTLETTLLTAADPEKLGYMWECPDFFTLNNRQVLMMSPQGIKPDGYNYRNLDQNGYIVGTWRPGQGELNVVSNFTLIDHGHDFYAPQTFEAPDGRRILIGWFNMWDAAIPERGQGWAGMLTLPREVTLSDDRLIVVPVREVEQLRGSLFSQSSNVTLKNEREVVQEELYNAEVIFEWNLNESDAERYGMRLGDADDSCGVSLHVDTQANRLILDRHYPRYNVTGYRSVALPSARDTLKLRVFFDHSSMEVFVNDGDASLSSRIYPWTNQRQLTTFAENGQAKLVSQRAWELTK